MCLITHFLFIANNKLLFSNNKDNTKLKTEKYIFLFFKTIKSSPTRDVKQFLQSVKKFLKWQFCTKMAVKFVQNLIAGFNKVNPSV